MDCCSSCGSPVPDGQSICSMCYGDPYYGNDGYYLEYLRNQEQYYMEQKELEEKYMKEMMKEEEALKQKKIEEERELLNTFLDWLDETDYENEILINNFLKERHDES